MKNRLLIVMFISLMNSAFPANVKFYNVNDLYGVSMRETASVCKDDNGFIWASSKTGVMRLAGGDCRIYPIPYQTTDIINVKLVYKHNLLIAYSNNGQVFCYNTVYDRFDFMFHLSRMLKNRHLFVSSVIIDFQGDLWISSSMGMYKYHQGKVTLIENNTVELRSIEYDKNHILFIRNDEIRLINSNTQISVCIYKNSLLSSLRSTTPLYYDVTDKKLWIGTTSDGIFCYDFAGNTLAEYPLQPFPKQPVQVIRNYTDSTLLVGIDGQGIWEISKRGNRVLNMYRENADDPSSIRGNGVYDIFCDLKKRVWICTYSGGLSYFNTTSPIVTQITHQINNANSLSNNNVNGVIEDSRGNLWFATDNGICCWEVAANQWKTFYHNIQKQAQVFLSLCEDDGGRIWAGTFSSGVYVLDERTGRELAHYSKENQSHSFSNNFVFDIFKDSAGDLWLGGAMGNVVCYVLKENTFKSYQSLPVYAFSELSENQMLAACTFGLCSLDKQTGKVDIIQDGYLLQDILVKGDDVWMCTCGDGLIRLNMKNKSIKKFTVESGMPSNFVNSVIESGGYLWLGTENGLCRFNPQDKDAQTYSPLFSLSSVSFNHCSCYKLHNGNLIFGTNRGAVLVDPETLQDTQLQGKIFFQDLIVSGSSIRENSGFKLTKPIDSLQEITLKYNQNNLTLELLPLGTLTARSKFSWKMTGIDKTWIKPSEHRRLTYTNLPTGQYTLILRMYDSSLAHIIAERQLLIRVTPSFWGTVWFRLLILAFAAGIIYFLLRFYINRLKQRHSEDKVRFFANTAHDIRTALTLITAPVEELNKELHLSELGKHYLSLATGQARHLSSIATQLLDFQKADIGKEQLSLNMIDVVELIANRRLMFESFAKNRNVKLLFTANPAVYCTAIDEMMIEKVIDNLISNAIKYSHPDSQVEMLFNGSSQNWTLEVKDHGIGISPKAQTKLFKEFYRSDNAINSKIVGSGIGLLLAKNYVNLHGGTIACVSQENAGSSFTIAIPFREVQRKNIPAQSSLRGGMDNEWIASPQATLNDKNDDLNHTSKKDMRLLIVEDNDDLRNFMQYPLQETFEVSTAEDGAQAWDMIQQQMPDLVISDVMMPNRDGFELCRLIKSTYETSHIPIVLLTSLTDKAQQLHGLGLGADDYVTKPFDMTLLTGRIISIIQNRKSVREKALRLIDKDNDAPILFNELNDKFVKKAVEVIRTNRANPEFGKEDFASAMNVSSSLLYKKIKSLTGQSPVDFIKTIRLNYALELLQSRKYSVTEVSEQCGFSSIGYFSTSFRKHFGKSPTDV